MFLKLGHHFNFVSIKQVVLEKSSIFTTQPKDILTKMGDNSKIKLQKRGGNLKKCT